MIGLVAATAATLLLLTGCASTPDAPANTAKSAESSDAAETVAPLTAEPPAAADAGQSPEDAYLDVMRIRLEADRPPIEATQIPNASDAQLLEAAAAACEQLAAGTEHHAVRVVDGETPNQLGRYNDSADIAGYASEFICTEYQL